MRDAWRELRAVLGDWLRGDGGLVGLLVAWWEVVSGRVAVDIERGIITGESFDMIIERAKAVRHVMQLADEAVAMTDRERLGLYLISGDRRVDDDLVALIREVAWLRGWKVEV